MIEEDGANEKSEKLDSTTGLMVIAIIFMLFVLVLCRAISKFHIENKSEEF